MCGMRFRRMAYLGRIAVLRGVTQRQRTETLLHCGWHQLPVYDANGRISCLIKSGELAYLITAAQYAGKKTRQYGDNGDAGYRSNLLNNRYPIYSKIISK